MCLCGYTDFCNYRVWIQKYKYKFLLGFSPKKPLYTVGVTAASGQYMNYFPQCLCWIQAPMNHNYALLLGFCGYSRRLDLPFLVAH